MYDAGPERIRRRVLYMHRVKNHRMIFARDDCVEALLYSLRIRFGMVVI